MSQKRLNPLKAGFAGVVAVYAALCALSPGTYRFLDYVNLVFHEAGHVLFGFFGEFLGVLGRLGLLRWDQALGNLIYLLGLALVATSVIGAFYQAAEKGPSAALPRSRGAATYELSTPAPTCGGYPSARAAPCTWAFLSSLRKNEFFSNPLFVEGGRGAFGPIPLNAGHLPGCPIPPPSPAAPGGRLSR